MPWIQDLASVSWLLAVLAVASCAKGGCQKQAYARLRKRCTNSAGSLPARSFCGLMIRLQGIVPLQIGFCFYLTFICVGALSAGDALHQWSQKLPGLGDCACGHDSRRFWDASGNASVTVRSIERSKMYRRSQSAWGRRASKRRRVGVPG